MFSEIVKIIDNRGEPVLVNKNSIRAARILQLTGMGQGQGYVLHICFNGLISDDSVIKIYHSQKTFLIDIINQIAG